MPTLPLRDYLYLGAMVVLFVGFGVFTHHERQVGAEKLAAKEAAVARAQEVHNTEVESRAQSLSEKAVAAYVAAHAVPTLPAPHVLCYHARPRDVPGNAGPAGGGDAATSVPAEATGPPYDPTQEVLADGQDADAQVKLLQDLIRSYQAAGVVAK